MEDITDDMLTVTIAIQTHGTVFNLDLRPDESNIFDNVRLLCKSEGFTSYETRPIIDFWLLKGLQKIFTRNLDKPTYTTLQNAETGILVNNITYDKIIANIDYKNPLTNDGVHLISIHKDEKLLFPKTKKDKTAIHLLNVSDLQYLADTFGTKVPNITDLSTVFPKSKIYIEEEEQIRNDNALSNEEKDTRIEQIRRQLYNNLHNWQLTVDVTREQITLIKLSTLIELIKIIIGKPCIINILDYSCNSLIDYIPEEQKILSQYALEEGDIEKGIKYTGKGGSYTKKMRRKNVQRKHKKRTHTKRR